VTISDAIEWYVAYLAAKPASPKTISTYRAELRTLQRLVAACGCERLEQLSPDLLRRAAAMLMAQPPRDWRSKGNQGAARIMVIAAKGMCRALHKDGCPDVPDLRSVATPRVPERLQPRLTFQEFLTIESFLIDPWPGRWSAFVHARDRALILFLFETGLRSIEVSRLDLGDVDLKSGMVRIREGKGSKPRLLNVRDPEAPDDQGGEVLERLRAYLELRRSQVGRRERALWVGVRGGRLSPASLRAILRQLCERAGLDSNRPVHAFRRGWFTENYLADPRELPLLSRRMGWSEHDHSMASVYTRGALMEFAARPRQLLSRRLLRDPSGSSRDPLGTLKREKAPPQPEGWGGAAR